jgi:hypothetical protein
MALREGGFVESLGPIRATPSTELHTPQEHPQTGRQEARTGRSRGLRWAEFIPAISARGPRH